MASLVRSALAGRPSTGVERVPPCIGGTLGGPHLHFRLMDSVLELAERLWTGQSAIEEHRAAMGLGRSPSEDTDVRAKRARQADRAGASSPGGDGSGAQ